MKIKYVSTQKELDGLIQSNYNGLIVIKNTKEEIDIRESASALIDVCGSAQIKSILDNAQLTVDSKDVIVTKAKDNSIIICYKKCKILSKQKTVTVIKTAKVKLNSFTLSKFIDRYAVEKEGKYIILYKSVNPDTYCDFKTGKIKYEIGTTVICPDWDEKFTGECGYGLHLSPTPYFALAFNDGKVLKCRVKISDCRTVKNPQYPTKVSCKQVEVLEEVKGLF